jgi:cellulose synthase/poly-beta-1,6-N-acetylglucosamine synthase-like glycosyltransferase
MVFWACAVVVVYVYFGFPLLLGFVALVAPRISRKDENFRPRVSLLISAYNEAPIIREKIENSLRLSYPGSLFEVLVVSDCSSDATDEIAREYAGRGVRLIRQSERLGKAAGLNLAVPYAQGDIAVFSDANAMYQPDVIEKFVRHFVDPRVGYVVGNARYIEKKGCSQSSESEGLYWKLETWLKRKESEFESVVGGDGAIYAIRRELYTPLLPTDINDFLNPLQIVDLGYRGLFDPQVICYEETADSFAQEFRRKVRIVSRAFNAVLRAPGVLNPIRNPRHWWLLLSHKVLRWLAPFFLLGMILASLVRSAAPFFGWAAGVQITFYLLALAGWVLQNRQNVPRPLSIAFYFCVVNVASFIGCIKCFRGSLSGTWIPHRVDAQGKS